MKHHLPFAIFCVLILASCAQKQTALPDPASVPAVSSSVSLSSKGSFRSHGSSVSSSSAFDGNVGAVCTSNDECQTPGKYLLMSSCPFSSRCIAHRCAVVCPVWQVIPDGSGAWKSRDVVCRIDTDCTCNYLPKNLSRCACIEGTCMTVIK